MVNLLAEHTLFQDINAFIIIGIIIFLSQLIYSAAGFGSGMFAISLLGLIYGNLSVFVPFFTLLCFPTESLITWKERRSIRMKESSTMTLFVIPPAILGSYLLKTINSDRLLILLGSIIILLSLYHIFWEAKAHIPMRSPVWIPVTGLFSGVLGGLFGMSGPPLIFYYKNAGYKKKEFRAALIFVFFSMSLVRIFTYISFHMIGLHMLISVFLMIPAALAGMYAGNKVHEAMSEDTFKKVTSAVLLASGLLILIKNL